MWIQPRGEVDSYAGFVAIRVKNAAVYRFQYFGTSNTDLLMPVWYTKMMIQQNYTTAEHWKRFIHIVDDVNPSAVLLPKTDEEPLMIFDINGNRLHQLTPGINIIKMKNGKNKKVVVNHGS
jgi:hypothetical protein